MPLANPWLLIPAASLLFLPTHKTRDSSQEADNRRIIRPATLSALFLHSRLTHCAPHSLIEYR